MRSVKASLTTALVCIMALIFTFVLPAQVYGGTRMMVSRIFTCSDQLNQYILRQIQLKEEYVIVSFPDYLPEAEMGIVATLNQALMQDKGYARWGIQTKAVAELPQRGEYLTYAYRLIYRSTQAEDQAAAFMAAAIMSTWNLGIMTDEEKVEKLTDYIAHNWRYDHTLLNNTAYAVINDFSGTCLGLALASQVMLTAMGIESQTIHGTLANTGIIHLKLLVNIDGWWLTFDPTALTMEEPINDFQLKNQYLSYFIPDSEYNRIEFKNAFPMNPGDLSNGFY